jgi:manganese efflux pump family protein
VTAARLGSLLVLGLLVGLDNLQVGAALGLVRMRARRRWAFAGAFALAETAMPLLGLAAGRGVARAAGPAANAVGIAVLAATGAVILALALRGEEAAAVVDRPFALVLLPLSLSFDNLFAGLGLGSLGYPVAASALTIGAVSGGLCALGLFAGGGLRRWVPERAELLSGVYLLALAAARLFAGGA